MKSEITRINDRRSLTYDSMIAKGLQSYFFCMNVRFPSTSVNIATILNLQNEIRSYEL